MSFFRTLSFITCVLFFLSVVTPATTVEPSNSLPESRNRQGAIQVVGNRKVNATTRFNTSQQPFTNYLTNDMLQSIEDVRKSMC